MTAPRALVTGVSSGIGAAVAGRLLDDGWDVLGVSRRVPKGLPDGPGSLTHVSADLGHDDWVEPVTGDAGRLDAVVHAAGMLRTAPLGALDHDDAAAMWRLHVEAPSRLLDALVDRLPDGARIVLVGSRTSTGAAAKSAYAASKAGVVGLARSWARELAPRGITVNVVAPGPTATAMLEDPARADTPPVVPPLGRLVSPDEVAGLVAYLVGPLGGSVTGQELVVCGGASL